MTKNLPTIALDKIDSSLLNKHRVHLYLLRLDQIHLSINSTKNQQNDAISGNKWFKLRLNLDKAKQENYTTILTFGGAYSNHIHATAAAAKQHHFKSIGIIRGEEYSPLNSTLQFAKDNGMQLHYVSRQDYKLRGEPTYINSLLKQFSTPDNKIYVLPEGGSNSLALQSCAEIPSLININYDAICCPVGSGGTISGIIIGEKAINHNLHHKILGFPAIKGATELADNIKKLINSSLSTTNEQQQNSPLQPSELIKHQENISWDLIHNYDFGGFAKTKPKLIEFIKDFYLQHQIKLDVVYTGKMLYGIFDLIKQNFFDENTTIIAVHTGGIQGNHLAESKGLLKWPPL